MNHPSILVIDLVELTDGGKAVVLGRLASSGTPIPPGICVTTAAYDRSLDEAGLRQDGFLGIVTVVDWRTA